MSSLIIAIFETLSFLVELSLALSSRMRLTSTKLKSLMRSLTNELTDTPRYLSTPTVISKLVKKTWHSSSGVYKEHIKDNWISYVLKTQSCENISACLTKKIGNLWNIRPVLTPFITFNYPEAGPWGSYFFFQSSTTYSEIIYPETHSFNHLSHKDKPTRCLLLKASFLR